MFNLRILLLVSVLGLGMQVVAQVPKTTNASTSSTRTPTYLLEGQAELLSVFVHHGLTQSKNDPALQSAFWFNFGPQFRLGLWGSNVSYDMNDTHLWFKMNADLKIDFNPQTNLKILYSENKYYAANNRNGNTIGLHLSIFEYKVIYELDSNWEGTETRSSYFAFQKTFPIFGSWNWDNQLGYSMLRNDGYSNYFDLKSIVSKKINTFNLKAGATWTSSANIMGGRGNLYFIAGLGVDF